LSGQFLQRSLFAAVDAILGEIVTLHTHTKIQQISENTVKLLIVA